MFFRRFLLPRRLTAFVLTFLLFFTSMLSFRPGSAYADYEPDDDFFAFLVEFVKQRNIVSKAKSMYDQYLSTGLSVETAFEIVKQQLSNSYTDSQAAMSAIKNTYKNLTSADKWKLIDFYNQIDINANFTVNLELFNNLNLSLFGNSITNDYNYNPPVINDSAGYIPISKTNFINGVLVPFSGYSSSTYGYSYYVQAANYNYVELYTMSPNVSSINNGAAWNNYVFGHTSHNYVSFNITGSSFSFGGYSFGAYAGHLMDKGVDIGDFGSFSGTHYTSVFKNPVQISLAGRYMILSDSLSIDTPQNIIINNNYNNINYFPYTNNTNPGSDMPNDTNWLKTLEDILKGIQVPVINIIINPEPTPIPTTPPTPIPTPSPGSTTNPGASPTPIPETTDPAPTRQPYPIPSENFYDIDSALRTIIQNQGTINNSIGVLDNNINVHIYGLQRNIEIYLSRLQNGFDVSISGLRGDINSSLGNLRTDVNNLRIAVSEQNVKIDNLNENLSLKLDGVSEDIQASTEVLQYISELFKMFLAFIILGFIFYAIYSLLCFLI